MVHRPSPEPPETVASRTSTPGIDPPDTVPEASRWDRLNVACLLTLALLAVLPAVWASLQGSYLAHEGSELPVRVWAFETFSREGVLGANVDIGAPARGALNNPDLVGTMVYGLAHLVLSREGAYNAVIASTLWANMAAAWWFVRSWLDDRGAGLVAAVGVGTAPFLLTYGVTSAITDQLHVWPWLLALDAMRRATEDRPARWGMLAGVWAGVGFLTNPYHAVVAVFGAEVAVVALTVVWWRFPRRLTRLAGAGAAALLAATLVAAPYALQLQRIMAGSGSKMSAEYVASTRHAPPWPNLAGDHPSHYAARLYESVALTEHSLYTRETGSRYARATASGLVLLGLVAYAVFALHDRVARRWALVALVGVVASTGPYLCLTGTRSLGGPWNPVYLLAWYLAPGGTLLLESFRYTLISVVCLPVAAALAVSTLRERGGRWRYVGVAAGGAILAETLLVSPVPLPLPTARLQVPLAYTSLATVIGSGALVELPFFYAATGRFERRHFLHQLVHRRPIADEVRGEPPPYLLENGFLRSLIAEEAAGGPNGMTLIGPAGPGDEARGRADLVAHGFAAVIIDPAAYRTPEVAQRVRLKLPLVLEVGDRWVVPLQEGDGVSPSSPTR